ncbi:MAG: UDP-3-O-acyl-N-acetylglucosamine deacetylase [Alphaproteobacteria bacterium]|nr:UDP-3-O-acyl-N-acetylglucosamine deacetylase [Alphaproteobacteria bacterium]MBV8549067.1 UDP-3-O-acyl-N-acetylglucosamine deacetylase [Alphaproteobacteria bacterium]
MPQAWLSRSHAVAMQKTLATKTQCSGIGVHSGKKVTLRLIPAPVGTGIVFMRTDLPTAQASIPARWDTVVDTRLCTVIGNEQGARVGTVEHLMSALFACGVDNLIIEIDSDEVPVMDGSADPFMFLIQMAGMAEQKTHRPAIEILTPVEVQHNGKWARLSPAIEPRFSFEIDFPQAAIGRQSYSFALSQDTFRNEISRARTFGFFEEAEQLRKVGLARGGSLDNAVVIKDAQIMNADGLRYADEFVRHKLLDAVGDLSLAGATIIGHFEAYCSGHAMNNRLLHALFADTSAWRYVSAEALAA